MSLLPTRPRPEVVIECRHCGRPSDGSPEACPTCGSVGLARYEIG